MSGSADTGREGADLPASGGRPGEAPLVVIADDDRCTREVLRVCLEREGYRVAAAGDGGEALALILATRPSGVLCDVRMPGLDGDALLREVRARPELRSIPVILMSGSERPPSLPPGCCAFLAKPLDPDTLVRLLREVTGAGGPVVE